MATPLIACLAPVFINYLSFFLLNRQLFFSTDTLRLFGISIGLALPITFASLIIGIFLNKKNMVATGALNPDEDQADKWLNGGLFSTLSQSLFLFIAYLFDATLKQYFLCICWFYLLFFLLTLQLNRIENNREQKRRLDQSVS